VPGNWAGAAVCWGLENREAAVRLVASGPANPHGANLELKVVDPSSNPYLALAALLGSARVGIERRLPLPQEVPVNPAESDDARPPLPEGQAAALDALAASATARELVGSPIVDGLLAVRRHEVAAFADRPVEETAAALPLAWSC
jgi:glutamine synthetase